MTSSDVLHTFVCACCSGERLLALEQMLLSLGNFDLSLLKHPDQHVREGCIVDLFWAREVISDTVFGCIPKFPDVLLNFDSVIYADDNTFIAQLYSECLHHLARGKIPPLSLANHNVIGKLPPELSDLMPVKEAMVSKSRVKAWIIQLWECSDGETLANSQCRMKAHIIVFPQEPEQFQTVLPPPLANVSTPICVVFIGSKPPTAQYLWAHITPLLVIVRRVRMHLYG